MQYKVRVKITYYSWTKHILEGVGVEEYTIHTYIGAYLSPSNEPHKFLLQP